VYGNEAPKTGLLRYLREQRWITPAVLLIVIGGFTLTAHGRGHTLFWAGVLLCAAGVLTGVVGYLSQRPGRAKDEGSRPA
jgi:drug/metabolite transporter (DMT)-like permease